MSDELIQEMTAEAKYCAKWARNNYNFAQAIFIFSVLSSFIAAILVGIGGKDWSVIGLSELWGRILLSAMTALPALFLLINNTFRFEERASWSWRKCRKTEKILRGVRDSSKPELVGASKEFSEMSEEMENEWPAFGSTPAQPKKGGT